MKNKLHLVRDIVFIILCIVAFKTKNETIHTIIWASIVAEIACRAINNIKLLFKREINIDD